MMKECPHTHMNIKLVISHAGGYGKCTFSARDARNLIRRGKLGRVKGGCISTDELF
jgi:hypothetical protein